MKKFLIIVFLVFGIIKLTVAATVNSLYQADVPVTSQSSEERLQAAKQGLAQVFIKLSGNSHVIDSIPIRAKLSEANNLIEQYSYTNLGKLFNLQIKFDTKILNQTLQQAKIPIWSQNRPLILAWVELEMPYKTAEIINDSSTEIATILKSNAIRRGLPLLMPELDVSDISKISVNDVVTTNLPVLLDASKRYKNDAMLVGRIFQLANGTYSCKSLLVMGTNQWNFEATGKTISETIAPIVDNIADTLAARFSVVVNPTVKTNLTLKIQNINDQNDLDDLIFYLKQLAVVADVALVKALENSVIVNVEVRGTKDSFIQTISAKHTLSPQNSTDPNMLSYQWMQNEV